jgi:hypothetical protein
MCKHGTHTCTLGGLDDWLNTASLTISTTLWGDQSSTQPQKYIMKEGRLEDEGEALFDVRVRSKANTLGYTEPSACSLMPQYFSEVCLSHI